MKFWQIIIDAVDYTNLAQTALRKEIDRVGGVIFVR
jgi:hypothetical protein